MNKKWNKRFIELTNLIASWSKDETKIGAVVVGPDKEIISTGYNGFPYDVSELPERSLRPEKYFYTSHAEENAILLAARRGHSVKNCIIYLSDKAFPCATCTRLIIQSEIKEVVCTCSSVKYTILKGEWKNSLEASVTMLKEANITITFIDEKE